MRILVTGGAGFIGSHIVDLFIAAGHHVAVVDNLHTGKLSNLNPQAVFYQVDIRDPEALAEVFRREQPEIISHQAALADVRGSLQDPATYAQVNIVGSIHLLELARQHGVRKFIYASTGGAVYGEPEFLPVTEDHPINPLDPYGASKHAVEHYLFLYRHNYGLDYVSLRYPNVYGPRQDPMGEAGVVAIFTGRMLAGQPCTINGDGQQQRDFTYVADIARANLLAAERGSGIYNIGSGIGTDVNTIFALLKEAAGYTLPPVYGPPKLGEVRRTYLDATKAQRELGWQPEVPVAEGLRRTVEYFRSLS
ncbi:MAG: SDR family oxidoreductase [Caldilineales bacterium]|nr:SDR family oxidoreductase [Caldilineales bacterium]MDW8319073.1 SDR family oxidoreductase [Anaerolineae bacterium]